MNEIWLVPAALAADLVLGDPESLSRFHPVVLMGKAIRFMESRLRRETPARTAQGADGVSAERNAGQDFRSGLLLAILLPAAALAVSAVILYVLGRIWLPAAVAVELLWCWQALAVKNLRDEALRVYGALKTGNPDASRRAVARIVGRDTDRLSQEGVTKAAVETVAENFSDGVVAPMLYMAIGGAPLALCYKAINTMDSMLGYKNERYLYFGKAAARLDDAANYVPSRFAAWLLIAAAFLTGQNGREAIRIWRRDRRNHASPNSAQCEAVAAGALEIRLAGPARYFGELYDKPYIGEGPRRAEPEDIRRICRMELAGSLLCAAVLFALRLLVWRVLVWQR